MGRRTLTLRARRDELELFKEMGLTAWWEMVACILRLHYSKMKWKTQHQKESREHVAKSGMRLEQIAGRCVRCRGGQRVRYSGHGSGEQTNCI